MSDAGPDDVQFEVAANLVVVPSPTTDLITFRAGVGKDSKTVTVPLTIEPARVESPRPNTVPLEGAKLERIGGKIYPSRIALVLPPPEPTRVVFVLIKKKQSDEPNSFYIMENKVWNALFAKFAKLHPEKVEGNPFWQPLARGTNRETRTSGSRR